MKRCAPLLIILALALSQPAAWAGPAREVMWEDLLPEGEDEIIAHGKVAALIRGGAHGSFDDQNIPMNSSCSLAPSTRSRH